MISYSELDTLKDFDWGGNYIATISDDGEHWAVANSESGDEQFTCASKEQAIYEALKLNADEKEKCEQEHGI